MESSADDKELIVKNPDWHQVWKKNEEKCITFNGQMAGDDPPTGTAELLDLQPETTCQPKNTGE